MDSGKLHVSCKLYWLRNFRTGRIWCRVCIWLLSIMNYYIVEIFSYPFLIVGALTGVAEVFIFSRQSWSISNFWIVIFCLRLVFVAGFVDATNGLLASCFVWSDSWWYVCTTSIAWVCISLRIATVLAAFWRQHALGTYCNGGTLKETWAHCVMALRLSNLVHIKIYPKGVCVYW